MRFVITVLIVLVLFSKSSHALKFKELESSNGIKFWFVEDNSIPIISMSFSFNGGSYFDPPGKEGLSNIMTSLLDEGTNKLSSVEFKQKLKSNGVKLYFSTQKHKIEGTFQVISSNKIEGFELLRNALNNPKFSENDILKIKNQVKSSIKIEEADISRLSSKKFNENFYINHNFSNSIKGSLESLDKIEKSDIMQIYKRNFQLSNLTIGISGNIGEKEVKEFVDLAFGNLNRSENNFSISDFESLKKGMLLQKIETPQTAVVFGQKGLGRNDKDFFAARILNYVIGGGSFQSRLYKNIREKRGLVYSIYSYILPYKNDGVIIGGFQTSNDSVKQVIKLVKKEWDSIKKHGISEKEFSEAKTFFKGSFSRNFTNTMSIANLLEIVQYYKLGADYFDKRDEIIDSLELESINQLASILFNSNELFFMIVGKPN